MNYRFPDVERAVVEILGEGAALWLDKDFHDRLPVSHVQSVGGREQGVLRMDRIAVITYDHSRDLAKASAEAVNALLVDGPHDTTEGLLDRVEVEVSPHLLPYVSETVTRYTATYRIDTRPI